MRGGGGERKNEGPGMRKWLKDKKIRCAEIGFDRYIG